MQQSKSSGVAEFQQLRGSWDTLVNRLYDDPKVTQLMSTRIGQYLGSHPVLALTVMLFSVMAVLPVGLFLSFALVTFILAALGFLFFEGFLLFIGGLGLLCVLTGIAFFSVVVSLIFSVFYTTIFNLLKVYYPHLIKQGKVYRNEGETSKEMQ